jgi:2-keto-3-deoxy-L-rhamnonate aldolase RhmA
MINQRALRLKRRLAGGAFCPGMWVAFPSPSLCELVADSGFDWVVVDAEHVPYNPETLLHILLAFRGSETVPIVRVPWNDAVMVKQALDMGWDGVLTPQTNTPDDVRRAVAACRYPPLGTRGFGPRRASGYTRDTDQYVALANDLVVCAIQIEDVAAANRIEEIIAVPGVDWIFVGPCDMSGTAGHYLDTEGPEVQGAIDRVFTAARAAGIPTCNPFSALADLERTRESGCPLVMLGDDVGFLRAATDGALAAFRATFGGRSEG